MFKKTEELGNMEIIESQLGHNVFEIKKEIDNKSKLCQQINKLCNHSPQ